MFREFIQQQREESIKKPEILSTEELLNKGEEIYGVDLRDTRAVIKTMHDLQIAGKTDEFYGLSNLFQDYEAAAKMDVTEKKPKVEEYAEENF